MQSSGCPLTSTSPLTYILRASFPFVFDFDLFYSTAGRMIKTGLTASVIVSQWTWAATLLQSSNVAWQYGVSGPFWYVQQDTGSSSLGVTCMVQMVHRLFGNSASQKDRGTYDGTSGTLTTRLLPCELRHQSRAVFGCRFSSSIINVDASCCRMRHIIFGCSPVRPHIYFAHSRLASLSSFLSYQVCVWSNDSGPTFRCAGH